MTMTPTPHPVERPVLAADVLHQDDERDACCQSCNCYGEVNGGGYCRRCINLHTSDAVFAERHRDGVKQQQQQQHLLRRLFARDALPAMLTILNARAHSGPVTAEDVARECYDLAGALVREDELRAAEGGVK